MKRAPGLDYESLRLEGGLLSPTLLDKVRHMTLPHQQPGDYGIEKGLTIRDELARYWRIARARWEAFEQGRHRQDIDLRRFTLDEWMLPLLETVLGYQVQANTQPLVKGERRFPITHRACDGAVPLVLTAPDQELDKGDVRFGEEGRRRSPQGLAQEYLNAEQDALWALVSNGRVLRLLRDNPAMTRPAYLEIDFQRLFDEDNFVDFSLVWLLLHHSRLMPRDGRPEGAILEQWREQGQQEGERALGELRVGVTQALRELGSGFLAHPDNAELRQALEQGELSPEGYFQELLRLVYRFLFLLTAEDRDLVLSPEADEATRELYRQGYSLGHLRERARYRRYHDRHDDAWEQLRITFEGFRKGQPLLGQPVLGGLFAADQCPHLDNAHLGNRYLYKALFHLGWFQSGDSLVRINYRDMDTEELGSVYESLLELVPVVQVEYRPWRFAFLGDPEPGAEPAQDKQRGSARKTTGSYYTPDSLVQELIRTALEPLIERTLKENREQPVEALLNLKVVDPAAGSGHFLLAAARRLAAEVARLRAGADQPTESDYRHALREVVAHCIYGVDLNPLAVELCKTALWLETVEPGKPLGF
ncbi:MAG TPA: SAM-dependent DNA methyltransferase, partial [Chromatiales bacterium]|nr:SAM-dependent DNA methyltransferase [Chromatiales bacterium]